jgi:hypothetical protein
VTDPTSPIKGTTLTVPAGAIASGDVQISITYQDNPPGPLPPEAVAAGAIIVSKTIVLTKDRPGTFDQPLTITIPYDASKLDPGDVPSVLYWDESTNTYDAVKVTNFDPATGMITFQTAHFSSYLVAAIKSLFGIHLGPLDRVADSNFRPSADGFSLSNVLSYSQSIGNCLGMSSFADWYFESAKNSQNGSLVAKFQKPFPDPDNEFVARELIVRAQAKAHSFLLSLATDQQSSQSDQITTGKAMYQALMLTHKPQIFQMHYERELLDPAEVKDWSHAVIVYKYEPDVSDNSIGTFYFYDPNQPRVDSTGIAFSINLGFRGFIGSNGVLVPAPNQFAFDSWHTAYSSSDMQNLFDGAKAGWNEGTYGKIDITSLTFDSTNRKATVASPDNVSLTGKVLSSGGESRYEPNHILVFIAHSVGRLEQIGDFQMTGSSFNIPIQSSKLQSGANDIVLLACKDDAINVGRGSCAYYGTFRQFEIFVTSTSVQFSAPTYSVAQTAGSATITVTRTGDTSAAATVQYATSDGTALAGQDYTVTNGVLTFNPTEASKTFAIPVLNNPASRGDRTVNLTLSLPSGTTLGTQSTAVLTITKPVSGPASGTITTVASANVPGSIAFDTAGNLYFGSRVQRDVWRVDAKTGQQTKVAGNGSHFFGGPGERNNLPATSVAVQPIDIAIDSSGNLYIIDQVELLRVDAQSGLITSVADGNSLPGCLGDFCLGWDPEGLAFNSFSNLYMSHSGKVFSVSQGGSVTTVAGTGVWGYNDNVPASSANLGYVHGIVFDTAGNMYLAEHGADPNNPNKNQSQMSRVRRVDAQTHFVTTVAGGGDSLDDNVPATNAVLSVASDVAIDAGGNLYIVDSGFYTVRRVDASTGRITTVAGILGVQGYNGDNQPATSASLSPGKIAFDLEGNLYIADGGNGRIRKVWR